MAPRVNDSKPCAPKNDTKALNDELMKKLKLDEEKENKRLEKEARRRKELEKAKNESYLTQASLLGKDQKTVKKQNIPQKSNSKQQSDGNITGAIAKPSNKSTASSDIWDESLDSSADNGWYSNDQQNSWANSTAINKQHSTSRHRSKSREQNTWTSSTSINKQHSTSRHRSNSREQNSWTNSTSMNKQRSTSRHRSNSREASWKTKNTFETQRDDRNCSRYSPVSSSPWSLSEDNFPALGIEAPIPKVNVWEKRKSKLEEIKALEPQNVYDEETMLLQALRLSMLEADQEKERQRKLEEEYQLQEEVLKVNPDLIGDFETSEFDLPPDCPPETDVTPNYHVKDKIFEENVLQIEEKLAENNSSSVQRKEIYTKGNKASMSKESGFKLEKIINNFGGWGLKENQKAESENLSHFLHEVIDEKSIQKNNYADEVFVKGKGSERNSKFNVWNSCTAQNTKEPIESDSWDNDHVVYNETGAFTDVDHKSLGSYKENKKNLQSEDIWDSPAVENVKSFASASSGNDISSKKELPHLDRDSNHRKNSKIRSDDLWASNTTEKGKESFSSSSWDNGDTVYNSNRDPIGVSYNDSNISNHCKNDKVQSDDLWVSNTIEKGIESFASGSWDNDDTVCNNNRGPMDVSHNESNIGEYSRDSKVQSGDLWVSNGIEKGKESFTSGSWDNGDTVYNNKRGPMDVSHNASSNFIQDETAKSCDSFDSYKKLESPKTDILNHTVSKMATIFPSPENNSVKEISRIDTMNQNQTENNYNPTLTELNLPTGSFDSNYIRPPVTTSSNEVWGNVLPSATVHPLSNESNFEANDHDRIKPPPTVINPLFPNPSLTGNIGPIHALPSQMLQFPQFNPMQNLIPNAAMFAGPLNPMLGMPVDPIIMRQMLMLSNPYFASQLQAMEQYYRSFGLPIDLMLTQQETVMQPQPVPGMMGIPVQPNSFSNLNGISSIPNNKDFSNEFSGNLHNIQSDSSTNNLCGKLQKTSQPPGFNYSLDVSQNSNNNDIEEDEDWFKKYLAVEDDTPAIPPPQLPNSEVSNSNANYSTSVSGHPDQILKVKSPQSASSSCSNTDMNNGLLDNSAPKNTHNLQQSEVKPLTAMEACISKTEVTGWSDPEDDKPIHANSWDDGWGNDNLPARSVKSSPSYQRDKKMKPTYRQPSSQPQFRKWNA